MFIDHRWVRRITEVQRDANEQPKCEQDEDMSADLGMKMMMRKRENSTKNNQAASSSSSQGEYHPHGPKQTKSQDNLKHNSHKVMRRIAVYFG